MIKRPLTNLLIKPIHLGEAKPQGLRETFALPPDESDIKAHWGRELIARLTALDSFFGLESDSPHIWERRGKALFAYLFDFQSDRRDDDFQSDRRDDDFQSDRRDDEWWMAFTCHLLRDHVPGFTVNMPGGNNRGRPREWTFKRLAELFADIEFLKKKKTRLNVSRICGLLLRRKPYAERWAQFGVEALRKAYSEAKKLRRQNFLFEMELCGSDAIIPAKGIDHIQAAIDLHSLQA
jgi:hypothetical protein